MARGVFAGFDVLQSFCTLHSTFSHQHHDLLRLLCPLWCHRHVYLSMYLHHAFLRLKCLDRMCARARNQIRMMIAYQGALEQRPVLGHI